MTIEQQAREIIERVDAGDTYAAALEALQSQHSRITELEKEVAEWKEARQYVVDAHVDEENAALLRVEALEAERVDLIATNKDLAMQFDQLRGCHTELQAENERLEQRHTTLVMESIAKGYHLYPDPADMDATIKSLEQRLEAAEKDSAFYRCCALSGEIPKEGSEPSAAISTTDKGEG